MSKGDTSSIIKCAFLRTERRIILSATLTSGLGIFKPSSPELVANSIIRSVNLLNGLSATTAAIVGSFEEYMIAVTAPMERPHRAIIDVLPSERRYSTTAARSLTSCAPRVTHSPSLIPLPAKSRANTVMPFGSILKTISSASLRLPALLWQ